MVDTGRHLGTEVFLGHVRAGVEIAFRFAGTPEIEMRIDGSTPRVSLRIPTDDVIPSAMTALENIRVSEGLSQGKRTISISVTGSALMLDGHAMLCSIADRIQIEHQRPARAISETISQWRSVLAARTRMSVEAEVGLFGELLVLRALLGINGPGAIDTWRGTELEEHDFGLDEEDLEIKTTVGEQRAHWISGLTQLVPSPGRPLRLVSIQLTRGGVSGETLSQLIQEVGVATDRPKLDARLKLIGWDEGSADLFSERWVLRSAPVAFNVTGDFPRLTPDLLVQLPVATSEIAEVSYRVDLRRRPSDVTSPGVTSDLLQAMSRRRSDDGE